MGTSIYYIRDEPVSPLGFLSFNITFSILLHLLVKSLIYNKLVGLLDQYKLQVETHMILHNLDSGVITCSKDAIKYFNENGKKLIDQAIANQDDNPEKQECQLEVEAINQKISKLQPTDTDCTQKRESQAKILSKPVFKEYLRGKKVEEQNGQEFSLQ